MQIKNKVFNIFIRDVIREIIQPSQIVIFRIYLGYIAYALKPDPLRIITTSKAYLKSSAYDNKTQILRQPKQH